MEIDPTRMCALLVGLPDVVVIGVGEWPGWLRIVIDARRLGRRAELLRRRRRMVTGVREVELVDLPVFGRPARLVWRKQRWRCPNRTCPVATWTEQNPRIASTRCALTDPGGPVGDACRSAVTAARSAEVAADLGCDWHTVMDAVVVYGTPLIDDPDRYRRRHARSGWTRPCSPVTARSDVSCGRPRSSTSPPASCSTSWPVATVPSRAAGSPPGPSRGGPGSGWATLDLSASYRTVFDTMLPDAVQVADPFHVVRRGQHGAR